MQQPIRVTNENENPVMITFYNKLLLNFCIKVTISIMGRSGSGSVGKGGREGNYAPPVDQYRKRIARQDSRKEKSHMKEVKHATETKDVATKAVKQIVSRLYFL